jgi:hypothetical protein
LIVALLFTASSVEGQCIADPGFTATQITPSGGPSVSSTYGAGWTGEFVHLQDDFVLDANFTITDCTVRVDAGFRILVQTGFTLTVDQSLITDCDNAMWSTIAVEDGATVVVEGGSTVANAEVGITSISAPGAPATFTVRDSRLENNRIGIDVLPFSGPGAHPGSIVNSEVFAPLLKSPYAGDLGFIGLRAQGVWDVVTDEGIVVGDPASTVTLGSNTNEWYDLEIGMLFVDCHSEVQNNILRGMITQGAPPSLNRGIGVGAASSGQLIVGAPVGGASGINNRIEDCEKGVLAVGLDEVDVLDNEILGSGGADPTMNQGVWVQNNGSRLLVQNNIVREFDSIGIYVRSYNGMTEVLDNTVENTLVVSNNSCNIAAIEMRAGMINAPTAVNGNKIAGVQFGIALRALLQTTEVLDNDLDFRLPAVCSGDFAFGIQAESADLLLIRDNIITADCPSCSNSNIRGMDITACPQFLVDENRMTDCFGFGLVGMDGGGLDVGPITDNIAIRNGAGNSWSPTTTANRTIAVTDAGSGMATYGTPPLGFTIPAIDWLFHDNIFGSGYNMVPDATFNTISSFPSTIVSPTFVAPGLPPCDFPPRLDAEAQLLARIRERKHRFEPIAQYLDSDSATSCYNRAVKRYFHRWMATDTSWLNLGVPSDVHFQTAFSALDATSFGQWWQYDLAMRNGDVLSAEAILAALTPTCPQDAYLSEVLSIWHNPALGDSVLFPMGSVLLPYDATQRDVLEQAATRSIEVGGASVYVARALIGSWDGMAWTIRQEGQALDSKTFSTLKVFPNPMTDIVYLESIRFLDTQPEQWTACIYDMQGRSLDCQVPGPQYQLVFGSSQWSSGNYILELRHDDGQSIQAQVAVP